MKISGGNLAFLFKIRNYWNISLLWPGKGTIDNVDRDERRSAGKRKAPAKTRA
jgi:hypothetical protein